MIEFVPQLSGTKIKLPDRAVFVIANTLVDSNKAASDGYNIRVAECRLGCWILAKKQGLSDIFNFNRFKDLQLKLELNLQELIVLVQNELHEASYTAEEVRIEITCLLCSSNDLLQFQLKEFLLI